MLVCFPFRNGLSIAACEYELICIFGARQSGKDEDVRMGLFAVQSDFLASAVCGAWEGRGLFCGLNVMEGDGSDMSGDYTGVLSLPTCVLTELQSYLVTVTKWSG